MQVPSGFMGIHVQLLFVTLTCVSNKLRDCFTVTHKEIGVSLHQL